MNKFVIAGIVVLFCILKWAYHNYKGEHSNQFLISLFVILIAFNFSYPIYSYFVAFDFGDMEVDKLGAFGNRYRLNSFFLIVPLCMFLGHYKLPKLGNWKNFWLWVVVAFVVISLLNPINPFPLSVWVFVFYAFQLLFSLAYLKANFKRSTIFKGLFFGFLFVTVLQAIITVFYPILNVSYFATLFKGEVTLEASLKREGYVSAIGIFGHPGPLAVYCLYVGIFFFACYLNNYRRKLSFGLLFANIFIILFTFSRTTYMTCVLVLVFMMVAFFSKSSVFSLKNIILTTTGIALLLFILYLTPLSELFLGSDFDSQIEVRLSSWLLGYKIWKVAPVFGVGINSHVYYMAHFLKITEDLFILEFLTTNPIHNIHMIVLSETGMVGFGLWLAFFRSKILGRLKVIKTKVMIPDILNLTFVGVLVAFILYGIFGWAPFYREIMATAFALCYFSYSREELQQLINIMLLRSAKEVANG
ncbi:hypothetical protein FKX85_17860 [Echinicola soli]|uniref:O-antigen ligase-related domain-containing protein n=1 Tax=Echinicola soli TaxID=2591634 RepID=A0A514CLU6_9BACT|nr:O-antigen ligase family protein [Echinicola soli]QDH80805.1 hypothetical protein FKX85_17860 [Echinicola soli]